MDTLVINSCGNVNALAEITLERVHGLLPGAGSVNLAEKGIRPCTGCDSCQAVHPGLCSIKDGQNDILMEFLSGRLAVIVTPVRFGCCNALTKNFMDRTEPLFLPFQVTKNGTTIMKPRYETYPDQVWLGIMEDGSEDDAAAFESFVINSNLAKAGKHAAAAAIKTPDDLNLIQSLLPVGGK